MRIRVVLGLFFMACGGALQTPGGETASEAGGAQPQKDASGSGAVDAGLVPRDGQALSDGSNSGVVEAGALGEGGIPQVDCDQVWQQSGINCAHPQCSFVQEYGCRPTSCDFIPLEHCPTSRCLRWPDCNGVLRCANVPTGGVPACGPHGSVGPACCAGTVPRCNHLLANGQCGALYLVGPNHFPMCLRCGNQKCEPPEDSCNCPEDCPAAGDGGSDAH